jgi:hydrogenase maturation protease
MFPSAIPAAMSLHSASDNAPPRILVYGYGNPGRQDDGAGVVFAEELGASALLSERPWLTFDTNYQLNAEDALTVAENEVVIFTDATKDQREGFRFRDLYPSTAVSFSTHAMGPESVLALAGQLYGAHPAAYLLTIRGYEWEPNGLLTDSARRNIEAAKTYIMRFLDDPFPRR